MIPDEMFCPTCKKPLSGYGMTYGRPLTLRPAFCACGMAQKEFWFDSFLAVSPDSAPVPLGRAWWEEIMAIWGAAAATRTSAFPALSTSHGKT